MWLFSARPDQLIRSAIEIKRKTEKRKRNFDRRWTQMNADFNKKGTKGTNTQTFRNRLSAPP